VGRELVAYSNQTAYNYNYNINGMRLSKVGGGVTTNYLYSGTQLLRESNGTDTIWYIYDQMGMVGFELNGTTYYYVRNLQGDVTRILNTSGTTVATYLYDAWGKVTIGTNTNSIATKNPIRYRGYYYDNESNFYYLQSRYYDPETGRFISPDVVAEGGNLYAYCANDPVNSSDPSGYLSQKWKKRLIKIGIGVVLATAAIAITVATGGAAAPVIASIAIGTAVGAGIGAGIATASHVMQTGSWEGAGQAALEGLIDGAVDGFLTSSAFAFAGAAINAVKSAGQGATAIGRATANGGCFIAGTAVLTAFGVSVIEDIKVGDSVWSYNEQTQQNELKEVVRLYRYEKTEIVRVGTSDGQIISATTEHPFYVVNQGWFAAKDLRAGDILLLVNGKTVIVELVQHELLESPIIVYNFEVADNHNYYVAESISVSANSFVLVHNSCGSEINNGVIGKQRVGSALKTDSHHAFTDMVDNYAGHAKKTVINNNAVKFELQGSLNGKQGVFEWMVNGRGQVFHRFFRVIK
jgi:RHS repeat-associated protein